MFSVLSFLFLFFPLSMQMRRNWLGVKTPNGLRMSHHELRKAKLGLRLTHAHILYCTLFLMRTINLFPSQKCKD